MRIANLINTTFWTRARLPILLQTEATECGLACLCMIASYWGHQIDIATMRRQFAISIKGVTLKALMLMAQGMSLKTRALKVDIPELGKMQLPCILHWDLNHFVVLKSISKQHAVIHDPAAGERRIALDNFANHYTGIALELTPDATFTKGIETQKFNLLSLMGRVIGLKRGLMQILLLGLALQIFALTGPFYMQWIVDEALISSDRDLITVLGCGFLLLIAVQTCITAIRSWVTNVLAINLNFQWLSNAFAHLLKLPMSYFEKRHTGDIVSRFGSIQTIQRSLTTQFVEGLIDGVLVLSTFTMMFIYSAQLALVASAAVLLYTGLRCLLFAALREATAEQIIHASKQQTHFLESIRGIQTVHLFHKAEERRNSWMNALIDQFNAELNISRLTLTYQTAHALLFNAERIIVIWLGALAVLDQRFSIGMLFAFISYKDQFSQRMASLVDKIVELRMIRLHGERVADIVFTEPEQDFSAPEIELDTIQPSIEIRNLSFRYADSEPNVLNNLNLTIPAGQCIAITGASGCGKTTLMKLLLGLIEPTEGEILIGGIKLSRIGLANYRNLIGTVMQEDMLFSGSINDNISFFDPAVDQQHLEECTRLASIHAEIMAMPMGYNTLIGDIGSGLSGGQKQRILLARALYKRPKIIFLDEATSHLDLNNEQVVNQAIGQIRLTRVIVAHRPETINMAQRIIELREGTLFHDSLNHPHLNSDQHHHPAS